MQVTPVILGSAFRKQGRAADARCGGRLSAVADSTCRQGCRKVDEKEEERMAALTTRRSRRSRLKDHEPLHGGRDFYPGLLGPARKRNRRCSISTRGKRERIGRMVKMHANKREDIDQVYAGDISAPWAARQRTTVRHACDGESIVLEIEFSGAGIQIAIRAEDPRLTRRSCQRALQKLAKEDPSFRVSGEIGKPPNADFRGMGELPEIIVRSDGCGDSKSMRTGQAAGGVSRDDQRASESRSQVCQADRGQWTVSQVCR